MKRLLKIREKLQKKRVFSSKKGHWRKCKESSWRAPKGIHNKLKRGKKGKGVIPSGGYRSPTEVRGTTPKGLFPVLVRALKDLEEIKTENVAILSTKLGKRKREQIRLKAQELKIKVIN